MTTDILIVSCGKHFNHLKYALRSIKKYANGFNKTVVLVPTHDLPEMNKLAKEGPDNLQIIDFAEWEGKGMLCHMWLIMTSTQYSNADFILHFDSDCIFTEPVTPDDYFENGKPVLMYADFDWLCNTQQANLRMWQDAVKNAIGGDVPIETMRRHPAVHYRELYPIAEECIEKHTSMPMIKYIRSGRNEFPQTVAEFPTLGMVAWRYLRDKYAWRDQQSQGFPHSKLRQAWTHAPPTDEDMKIYTQLGLTDNPTIG